jgi:hypothetical protein
MIRRWSHYILAIAILLVNAAVLRAPAYAADCLSKVDAPGCAYGLPADQYQAALDLMAAHPTPPVQRIAVDQDNVIRYSDTRSKPARMASKFSGVLFGAPPALPMGWVLRTTRPHVLPRWEADITSKDYVGRYTVVNLYATVHADGTDWYLIGPGAWLAKTGIARLVQPSRPGGVGGRWVAVDVRQQVLTAYEDDHLVFATLISSGKGKRYTRLGLTPIYLRQVTGDMSALMGTPDAYNIYDVPFVMYFNSGMALHGASWHDNFGTPMSHGCVNMSVTDAHWLFDWTESAPGAAVYVWRS